MADSSGDLASQVEIIKTLASEDYCGTDPVEGTAPSGLLRGVRAYVQDAGYRCQRLEYKGWRPVGRDQQGAVKGTQPDLGWLRAAIRNPKGAVWVNVGWYAPGAEPGEWRRTGGHWISLVGFRADEDEGEPGTATFVIRNSLLKERVASEGTAKNPGAAFANDTIQFTLQAEGEAVSASGEPRSLEGTYQLSGPALPLKRTMRAFMDAAVVLIVGGK